MRRFLLLAALWLVFGAALWFWPGGRAQSWMLGWWAPVADALHAPARAWHAVSLWWTRQKRLVARVRALERENTRARLLRAELDAVRAELAALKELTAAMDGVPAWRAVRVVGSLPGGPARRLLVAGRAAVDEPVIAAGGLVGVVDEVRGDHAVVRTILDASMAVPATDASRRLALLVRGEGARLVVRFAPADAGLAPGEIVYTSGAGGLFPPGVPVARITRVQKAPGRMFLAVEAEPAARWRTAPYLALVPRP